VATDRGKADRVDAGMFDPCVAPTLLPRPMNKVEHPVRTGPRPEMLAISTRNRVQSAGSGIHAIHKQAAGGGLPDRYRDRKIPTA